MSYRIPIGPYHLALEEPYKIELDCQGERVTGATLKVGFNFAASSGWLSARTSPRPSLSWSACAASVPMCIP